MTRPGLMRALPVVIAVVALGAAVFAVVGNRTTLVDGLHRLGPATLVWSLLLGAASTIATFLLWEQVLTGLGGPTRRRMGARVFFVSQLGKYVPGSVWPVVAQMEFGRRTGIARKTMLAANVITLALSLAVGLAIAAAALPFSGTAALRHYWWTFLALPVLLSALHPAVVPAALNLVFRVLRRQPLLVRLPVRRTLSAAGWAAVSWLLLGLHLVVLTRSLGAHGVSSVAAAVGGVSLAVAAGIIVIPAPAGAGIRDAVLVAGLAASLGAGAALVAALTSRALLIIVDIVLAGVSAIMTRPVPGDAVRAGAV